MSIINKRLFDDLFKTKSVKYNRKLYEDAFDLIWPCTKQFQGFLMANEFDVKLDYAKKIYLYFQTIELDFLPNSIVENMIYLQQHHLVSKGGYIPQDHVVHSINLYILGIYVFFNTSLFQSKLIKNNSYQLTQNENFMIFLRKWTVFALYHDVGYVFESLINGEGFSNNLEIIKKYKKTKCEYVNKLCFRSLSNIIFDLTLVSRSNNKFDSEKELMWNSDKWYVVQNTSINKINAIKDKINIWNDYVLLNDINDINGLSNFFILFDEDCFFVIKDESNYSIAFMNKKFCYVTERFYKSNCEVNYDNILSVDNLIKLNDAKIKFYIKDPKEKIIRYISYAYKSDMETIDEKIPQNIKTNFSFITDGNSITNTICEVDRWLEKESGYKIGDIALDINRYEKNYSECLSSVIRSEVNNILDVFIKENLFVASSLEEKKELLCTQLSEIDKGMILGKAQDRYDHLYGVSSVVFKYLDSVVKKSNSNLLLEKSEICFFDIVDDKIELHPFKFDENNHFAKKIIERIKNKSKDLSIDFEDLIKYHDSFSICDHGVVSAAIIFDVVSLLSNIVEYERKNKDIMFSWAKIENVSELMNEKNIEIFSDSIFSILLHNVYTKKAKPDIGINYKHNIDNNPFCYFCALIDVLQKWDRAKSIDFSVLDLPTNHYLGQDYDLNIVNDEIRIICNLSNTSLIKNSIDEMDDYLPGVKNFIKVTEIEV